MKLGNYMELHVLKPNLTVSEEEIDNILKRYQRRNAVVVHIDDGENIRKILESPPIDDEFALDFSEFDTLSAWREDIREMLEERRLISADEKVRRTLLRQIMDDSDIPVEREQVQEEASLLHEELLDGLAERGMTFEDYLERSGKSRESVFRSEVNRAVFSIRSDAILEAIAEQEHLTVSPEEVTEGLESFAREEGEDPAVLAEELNEEDMKSFSDELLMEKAMEFVIDHAVFTD